MASPFKSVTCAILYNNHRQLSWELNSEMTYPTNSILQVENSRAGGPWEVLADDVFDQCIWEDPRIRNYNKYMNEHYRLRLILPTSGEEFVSDPVAAGTIQCYPFSTEAQNIIRQVEKAIELSGVTGVLLKRKHWGPRCPDCTDFDGQSTVNEHCPRCLGTGYDGGYYQGITLNIIKDDVDKDESQGFDAVEGKEDIVGRCIAYPWIRFRDVWVEDGTNKRYYVHQVKPTSIYKQVPLIYTFRMRRIEYTDVLYSSVADDRVNIKDLYASAEVNYTPQLMEELEEDSINRWDEELSKP